MDLDLIQAVIERRQLKYNKALSILFSEKFLEEVKSAIQYEPSTDEAVYSIQGIIADYEDYKTVLTLMFEGKDDEAEEKLKSMDTAPRERLVEFILKFAEDFC